MAFGRLALSTAAPLLAAGIAMAGASAPAAAVTNIKIGSPTINEATHEWMKVFKTRVEKRAPDRFTVGVFPLSQLGTIPRMIEGVQFGTIEMAVIPPDFMVGIDKRFGILSAPGVFDDLMHGYRVTHDPEFKKAFWTLGEKKGVQMFGINCTTDSNIGSRTPIRKIADFKGKKIRVFASAMERETMKRLGATAAPMPLAEVLPAIQRGVLDGAKTGMVIFVALKYVNTAKYVTRTNESLVCTAEIASKSWLGKLSESDRKIVIEESEKNDPEIQQFSLGFNENTYKVWQQQGGELIEFSPAEKKEFRDRLATVGDAVAEQEPELKEIWELVKRLAVKYRGTN